MKGISELELPQPSATIIDRLRYLIKLSRHTQAQFAKLINVDPSNMSKIMSDKLPISDGFINRIVVNFGVSKEWLVSGTDIPFPKGEHAVEITDNGTRSVSKRAMTGAPIYDIDVTAGCKELSQMFTEERIIGHFDLPQISPDNPIVHVSGDSMVPRICNGAFLSIRPISDRSPISWGQIYVIVLEDYRLVKYVRRHPNPDMVILHSANPEYDDMEIRRSDIMKLYLVEAILNYDITA
jgi:phage repressor protein C with HTH and peptisase S24 domain